MAGRKLGRMSVDRNDSKEQLNVLKRVRDGGRLAKRSARQKGCTISRGTKHVLQSSSADRIALETLPDTLPTEPRHVTLPTSPATGSEHVPCDLVALDCEMVATRTGSALAQCTILSYDGDVLFHEYVRPTGPIVDYRTRWSGVLPHHMKRAVLHEEAVIRIKAILDGKVCIGHDLPQDFSVIGISFRRNKTRDTAFFKPLRTLAGLVPNQPPSLRNLALCLLDRKIQTGAHNSLEDARAALDIYRKHEQLWETHLVEQNWDKTVWLQDQYWPQEIVAQC